MNETKTKQSVTQQKSNWKPWQIVLVILLGLCALPVVVPVGLGLLAAVVGIAVALGACVLGLLACSAACGIGMILVLAALLLGGVYGGLSGAIGMGIADLMDPVYITGGFAILGSGFMMTGSAILGTALLIGLVWLIWKGILWIRSKAGGKKKAGSAEPEPEAAPGEQMTGTSAAETDSNGFHLLERKETDSDEK